MDDFSGQCKQNGNTCAVNTPFVSLLRDPRMGYAIESQRNTSSAPVTYLLEDVHNGVQDAQSPHICVPSNPLPLSCLQGVSAEDKR